MASWRDLARHLKSIRDAARNKLSGDLNRFVRQRDKFSEQDDEPEPETEVELLGRHAAYDDQLWQQLQASEVRTVESSNVYSYAFDQETATSGTLFVTFLDWKPGQSQKDRKGPGSTYAYSDVPVAKYQQFQKAAKESAGSAVWDYLRIRKTVYGHQHRCELIQVSGDYVPRKSTQRGLASRTLVAPGLSPSARRATFKRAFKWNEAKNDWDVRNAGAAQFFKKSTLQPEVRRGSPRRGTPNRGEPNRG